MARVRARVREGSRWDTRVGMGVRWAIKSRKGVVVEGVTRPGYLVADVRRDQGSLVDWRVPRGNGGRGSRRSDGTRAVVCVNLRLDTLIGMGLKVNEEVELGVGRDAVVRMRARARLGSRRDTRVWVVAEVGEEVEKVGGGRRRYAYRICGGHMST